MEIIAKKIDPSKTTAEGEGLNSPYILKPTSFRVYCRNLQHQHVVSDSFPFTVNILNEDKTKLDYKYEDNKDGTYTITYTPLASGSGSIEILVDGQHIKSSPFSVLYTVLPERIITVEGIGVVGAKNYYGPVDFTIHFSNLPYSTDKNVEIPITASVTNKYGKISQVEIVNNSDGTFTGKYYAYPGKNFVNILVNGVPSKNSPLTAEFFLNPDSVSPEGSIAYGQFFDGNFFSNKDTEFTIQTFKANGEKCTEGGSEFVCTVHNPEGEVIDIDVVDNEDGTYTGKFKPKYPGRHVLTIRISLSGDPSLLENIQDSPFVVNCLPGLSAELSKVSGNGVGEGPVFQSEPATIRIIAFDCSGELCKDPSPSFQIVVFDSNENIIPVEISRVGDGLYEASYTPHNVGIHNVIVKAGDEHIAASPYEINVEEVVSVENSVIGPFAFSLLPKNKTGNMYGEKALKKINVSVYGPDGNEIENAQIKYTFSDNRLHVEYNLPRYPGIFTVNCKIADRHVLNSPIKLLISG